MWVDSPESTVGRDSCPVYLELSLMEKPCRSGLETRPTGMYAQYFAVLRMLKRHKIISGFILLVVLYLVLLIPDPAPQLPPVESSAMKRPFIWNQDARWDSLEANYALARSAGEGAVQQVLEN